jgi:hypothetical protein
MVYNKDTFQETPKFSHIFFYLKKIGIDFADYFLFSGLNVTANNWSQVLLVSPATNWIQLMLIPGLGTFCKL